MIDTLRILVSWKCNLKCSYCCNEQEQFRKDIHPVAIEDIPWHQFKVFCISGGEPLLNMPKVRKVCKSIPHGSPIIFYTNGLLLTSSAAEKLFNLGITAVNVGLHNPETHKHLIRQISLVTRNVPFSVRFHAQDVFKEQLTQDFPHVSFRFWKMNDCDRNNECRIVLK